MIIKIIYRWRMKDEKYNCEIIRNRDNQSKKCKKWENKFFKLQHKRNLNITNRRYSRNLWTKWLWKNNCN